MERPSVVIVGCGFAGLNCTRALARAPVRVTLVDRRNHHLFQPLLYQVATAGLSPGDIAYPVRSFIRKQRNLDVVLAEVSAFDLAARRVLLSDGRALRYDQLLVATGAGHSYFGRPDWARFAPGLKTIEDAIEIRRRIFVAFEEPGERAPEVPPEDHADAATAADGGEAAFVEVVERQPRLAAERAHHVPRNVAALLDGGRREARHELAVAAHDRGEVPGHVDVGVPGQREVRLHPHPAGPVERRPKRSA